MTPSHCFYYTEGCFCASSKKAILQGLFCNKSGRSSRDGQQIRGVSDLSADQQIVSCILKHGEKDKEAQSMNIFLNFNYPIILPHSLSHTGFVFWRQPFIVIFMNIWIFKQCCAWFGIISCFLSKKTNYLSALFDPLVRDDQPTDIWSKLQSNHKLIYVYKVYFKFLQTKKSIRVQASTHIIYKLSKTVGMG